MLGGGLAREDSVADQAFAYVLTEDVKDLANSIGTNGCSDGIVF